MAARVNTGFVIGQPLKESHSPLHKVLSQTKTRRLLSPKKTFTFCLRKQFFLASYDRSKYQTAFHINFDWASEIGYNIKSKKQS